MGKVKVMFLLGNININGGIGRVTSIICSKLVDYNYDVFLLCFNEISKDKASYYCSPEINIISLNTNVNMREFLAKGGIGRLIKIIKAYKINILVACGALFFPISVISCKLTNTKCICWEHSNFNNCFDHRYQKLCRKIATIFADAIVTITKKDQTLYKKNSGAKRIYQIYNPLDDSLLASNEYNSKSKKIISVGRLTYQKNYQALIKVASVVLNNNNGWSWDIYGEGEDYDEINKMIIDNGIVDKICLKGNVPDLYKRYSDYSFLVSTSRYEGFGMALLEALSNRLPLISFDVDCGPNEIIRNGKNGYLVENRNIEEMCEKISSLCKNEQLRIKMSRETINDVSFFSLKEIIIQWKNMLEEIYENN